MHEWNYVVAPDMEVQQAHQGQQMADMKCACCGIDACIDYLRLGLECSMQQLRAGE
jgi:hypothetical protein